MAITNKLITFNKLTSFETQLANGNILDTSIVFIKDAKKIWTKGTYFDCSGGGASNIAVYETTDVFWEDESVLTPNWDLAQIIHNNNISTIVLKEVERGDPDQLLHCLVFNLVDYVNSSSVSRKYVANGSGCYFEFIANNNGIDLTIHRYDLALKSDIPNTDNFLQYLDPTLKTITANGLLGDDDMIYALPNSSIIESEDYDKILATRDEIGYTTEFSVADIEAVYGRGITKPINVQGLISAIEANKPIIIPTNITDASNVGGNAVTMAKMENDGFIYLNVIVPYLDGVHKEYFIQIKITTAQLIKSGSNGSITLKELVAKTDLKTINGESILGSGDIAVGGKEIVEVPVITGSIIFLENEYRPSFEPNKIYYATTPIIESVSIISVIPPTEDVGEYSLHFYCNKSEYSNPLFFEVPSNWLWTNGETPSLEPNTHYELSVVATKLGTDYIYKAVLTPFKSV